MKIDIRKIDVKKDKRGWLIEAVKSTDTGKSLFGLVHVTCAKPGFSRGGHYHKRKKEWFCVISGKGELYLRDIKSNKEKTIFLGGKEMKVVGIPPYVFHSIKNKGRKEMLLLGYVSEDYNPKDPDTFTE